MKLKTLLSACVLTLSCISLSGCDNVAVYGSMTVGNSWGSYPGYGGSRMGTSVTISGRIR
ncbi:hypothetical protein [Simiduia agarivorans]|uniref:Lipoprotein n=1 Tax=Simiduia agarivorans (strain DSM 21679 / JCM 13881 / BCRC 17597 / SA1) TaxID=1117647 RepID=R9S5N4_SIMAS|nr:hypothetical protein [Simiduia agarivorans]AGN11304.1 hypothetical protein M5M_06827 [Simiduia agarivorans SA1 = DSM 21679]